MKQKTQLVWKITLIMNLVKRMKMFNNEKSLTFRGQYLWLALWQHGEVL